MEKQQLLQILAQLHDELAQADASDPTVKQALQILSTDISRSLSADQNSSPGADANSDLSSRWKEFAQDLESKHPTAASLLQQVTDLLSGMGI